MIKSYLKIAWRNIHNNKLHSFINILGLAVAFSVCIILFLTAYFQFSYDSFHDDKDQLFKTSLFVNTTQGNSLSSNLPLPLKSALEADIPDIETAVIINRGRKESISYENKSIDRVIVRTNPEFFDLFNFPVSVGDKTTALSGIQDIALSESTAKALFGDINPIGKQIEVGKIGEEKSFIVSAVVKDCPGNSSIHFEAVARIESLPDYKDAKNNWGANASNIFIRISGNSNKEIIENKLLPFVEKHYADRLGQLRTEHAESKETRELLHLNLTNIEDVRFSGERSAPLALIYAIMGLGAFILLIACFNFVNLNLADSFKRSRELGVRKTLGAFKGQLFMQLWGEACILYFIGFIIGIGLAYELLPVFNSYFDVGIQLSTLFQPAFLALMLGVFVLVSLIAGGYPALKMMNFRLVEILKGNVSTKKPGTLRNTLLVSQFAISGLLICVSVIAAQQLDFLKQKPIGFEKEQVISIPVGEQLNGKQVLARLRNELANDPTIVSVSGAGGNLGRGRDRITSRTTFGFLYNEHQIEADRLLADFGYLETLEIPVLKGRDFSPEYATDTINAVVVTESFVEAMGEANPIGKYFGGEDSTSGNQIIGVVPDFNAYSPTEKTLPIAIHLSADEAIRYILLKVRPDSPLRTMEKLAATWETVSDNVVFNGSFLDENLQAWYEEEHVMTLIFGLAAGIAIFLSCLGLFAISLLVIEFRTKEIGIRKVMGASVNGIVRMISLHFLKLVFISLLISLPLAWFAMQNWLENYAYRMEINPLTFLGVSLLVAVVALATVSYHCIKAAIVNPVKSLRTE